ncbi:MAG: exodeoxyribonuclease III [Planctomycetaceae bacterium]|nr:exodeoxyribonuclease III [Planctomycetaceae bacterium]
MKIATWNVNSIRAREERLLDWLERTRPDAVCLQEIKVVDQAFPYAAIEAAGYQATVFGQKTYNGVAILSLNKPDDVQRGFGDDDDDAQARLLRVKLGGVEVISAYVPNGESVGSDKWAYKLRWMRRLGEYLARRFTAGAPVVLCGDFNVARDDLDVARPDDWAESVLCHPEIRAAMDRLLGWGLVDVVRRRHPEGKLYSWWDYRNLAFPRNEGLRLDYILATEPMAARLTDAAIDRQERKSGGATKPSDHAPVVAVF